MGKSKRFNKGDRVRIVRGAWASDCGTVTSVTKKVVRVRTDTPRSGVVIVKPRDLVKI